MQSSATLGYTLDEWLKTVEVEASTRDGYIGYIECTIRPTLGAVPIARLSTRTLETFYAELRRCVRAAPAHSMRAGRWPRRPSGRCTR